jgi:L-seryl-tRNA(Ser) seleniumtransferase
LSDWLPYTRGEILRGTADDVTKLRRAWDIVRRREADRTLYDFTGLERSMDAGDGRLDDELGAALWADRLVEAGLEHLGGTAGRDDAFLANRTTAAIVASMQVLVRAGDIVAGVAAGYSHPAVVRAVRLAGGELREGLEHVADASVVVVTRLAVTYELLPEDELRAAVDEARSCGATVFVDDAGGARVGPAVFGQPKTLELGADVGVTGLDKYGTIGPRLGLLAGRAGLVSEIRSRAFELGLEARPMLYRAAVASLEQYRPERVRELVEATRVVGDALAARMPWIERTPVAVRITGEGILAEAMRRAGIDEPPVAPIEATAALAMVLLRDHGILTVHFAALPPGTSALLVKFVPPEVLERFGGAAAFAAAVDESLDEVAGLLERPGALAAELGVSRAPAPA